jgi:hypothetical protein
MEKDDESGIYEIQTKSQDLLVRISHTVALKRPLCLQNFVAFILCPPCSFQSNDNTPHRDLLYSQNWLLY